MLSSRCSPTRCVNASVNVRNCIGIGMNANADVHVSRDHPPRRHVNLRAPPLDVDLRTNPQALLPCNRRFPQLIGALGRLPRDDLDVGLPAERQELVCRKDSGAPDLRLAHPGRFRRISIAV